MASRLLESTGQPYGLIISDCQMPVLNGYSACTQIRQLYREHNAEQPFYVACTGNVEDSQIKQAFDSGFDELVQKPATVAVLTEILRQVMAFVE